jgi:hypothetical protein
LYGLQAFYLSKAPREPLQSTFFVIGKEHAKKSKDTEIRERVKR